MLRRTAEANRAIAEAWKYEQQLVKQGKGTRNWTPEQQQDILEKGRAYDDDGKAFEGHHMKSVEKFPEYQGDCKNIQFLSRPEHFSAHNGNYQNPTNGYYDPISGVTVEFPLNECKSCDIITLSKPVAEATDSTKSAITNSQDTRKEKETVPEQASKEPYPSKTRMADSSALHTNATAMAKNKASGFKKIFSSIGNHIKKITDFISEHGDEILDVVEAVGSVAGTLSTILGNIVSDDTKNGSSSSDYFSDTAYSYESTVDEDDDVEKSENIKKKNRASPHEHSVSGYDRMQNGKIVHVNSYTRGKKKST